MKEIQVVELSTDLQLFLRHWDCIVNVAILVVQQSKKVFSGGVQQH